jgi:hypothetical protein
MKHQMSGRPNYEVVVAGRPGQGRSPRAERFAQMGTQELRDAAWFTGNASNLQPWHSTWDNLT